MNTRTVLIVGVAAAALLATALAVTRRGDAEASATAGAPLFPELRERINDAAKVTVAGKDGAFVMSKTASASGEPTWGAAEKGGFPVKFERLKELTVGISRFEIVEPMTKKPEMHARLELADPSAEEGGAKRVTIEDGAGKVLADVLIGKPKVHQGFGGKGALYVRKGGDDQAWEVTGQVNVAAEASAWLDRDVSKIESARVKRVTVHHADGSALAVSKSAAEDANFGVENLPAGAELQWEGVANGMASALQYMSLDDVQRNEAFDLTGATTTEFQCFDGLVVTARTVEKDGKTWMTLAASFDESLRPQAPVGPPPPAPTTDAATDAPSDATTAAPTAAQQAGEGPAATDASKPAEPDAEKPAEDPDSKLKKADDVRKEVDELNAKWSPWVYQVPGYNAANLRKKLADLLKKDEPEDATDDPASLLDTTPPDATDTGSTDEDHSGHDHAAGEHDDAADVPPSPPAETSPTEPPADPPSDGR